MATYEEIYATEQAALASKKKLIDTKKSVDELLKKAGFESMEDFDAKLNAAFITVPKARKAPVVLEQTYATKEERQAYVKQALLDGKTMDEIAVHCKVQRGTIHNDKKALGLVKAQKQKP